MNYEQASDDLLNVKVKNLLFGRDWVNESALRKWHFNNPADAWPVIVENEIMLNPNCADGLWKAEQGFREKPKGFYKIATCYSKNPLRAAMIVFLMMNEGKQ